MHRPRADGRDAAVARAGRPSARWRGRISAAVLGCVLAGLLPATGSGRADPIPNRSIFGNVTETFQISGLPLPASAMDDRLAATFYIPEMPYLERCQQGGTWELYGSDVMLMNKPYASRKRTPVKQETVDVCTAALTWSESLLRRLFPRLTVVRATHGSRPPTGGLVFTYSFVAADLRVSSRDFTMAVTLALRVDVPFQASPGFLGKGYATVPAATNWTAAGDGRVQLRSAFTQAFAQLSDNVMHDARLARLLEGLRTADQDAAARRQAASAATAALGAAPVRIYLQEVGRMSVREDAAAESRLMMPADQATNGEHLVVTVPVRNLTATPSAGAVLDVISVPMYVAGVLDERTEVPPIPPFGERLVRFRVDLPGDYKLPEMVLTAELIDRGSGRLINKTARWPVSPRPFLKLSGHVWARGGKGMPGPPRTLKLGIAVENLGGLPSSHVELILKPPSGLPLSVDHLDFGDVAPGIRSIERPLTTEFPPLAVNSGAPSLDIPVIVTQAGYPPRTDVVHIPVDQ